MIKDPERRQQHARRSNRLRLPLLSDRKDRADPTTLRRRFLEYLTIPALAQCLDGRGSKEGAVTRRGGSTATRTTTGLHRIEKVRKTTTVRASFLHRAHRAATITGWKRIASKRPHVDNGGVEEALQDKPVHLFLGRCSRCVIELPIRVKEKRCEVDPISNRHALHRCDLPARGARLELRLPARITIAFEDDGIDERNEHSESLRIAFCPLPSSCAHIDLCRRRTLNRRGPPGERRERERERERERRR